MAQRLTASRQLFYGIESPSPGTGEGVDPGNEGASTFLTVTNLVISPDLAFFRRPIVGQMGTITGKIGDQTDPWLMFTMPCLGGVSAVTSPLDPLLAVVLSPKVDNSSYADTVA